MLLLRRCIMNIIKLITDASIVVQLILLILLFFSVFS